MEQNYLKMLLEHEERLNKIVEVLALSPATHWHVDYYRTKIELCAYTHQKEDTQQVENLLRVFANSTDRIEMSAFQDESSKFWTTKYIIEL